jgi:hypothetical protein
MKNSRKILSMESLSLSMSAATTYIMPKMISDNNNNVKMVSLALAIRPWMRIDETVLQSYIEIGKLWPSWLTSILTTLLLVQNATSVFIIKIVWKHIREHCFRITLFYAFRDIFN